MIRVEIYSNECFETLEDTINQAIEDCAKLMNEEVVQINYSSSCKSDDDNRSRTIVEYSAMITFKKVVSHFGSCTINEMTEKND